MNVDTIIATLRHDAPIVGKASLYVLGGLLFAVVAVAIAPLAAIAIVANGILDRG